MTTSQGTYYTEALQLAHEELLKSDATTKHIIFLSDGEPSDRGYTTAVQNLAKDSITVSTIALGYSSSVLSSLADFGGGRYYTVKNATDLPDIMLSETEKVGVSSLIKGEFVPQIQADSPLTDGINAEILPTLSGYLGVTLKENAEATLTSEDGNPIYAVWQYGIGTVASFMSDLEGKWSGEWLTDELGQLLITRMMTTTIDDTHDDSSMRVYFDQGGNKTAVTVECVSADAGNTVTLTVAVPNGESQSYVLDEISAGVYVCDMDTFVQGVYQTMIVQYNAEGNAIESLNSALAVSYSTEYDAFCEAGDRLLGSICSYSEGIVTDDISKLADIEMDRVEALKDPLVLFVIVSAFLMLVDFIIRLLRWKDVKEFVTRMKTGKKK